MQTANIVTKLDTKRAVLSACHFVLDGGSACGVFLFSLFMGNKVTTAKRTSAIKVCVDVRVHTWG